MVPDFLHLETNQKLNIVFLVSNPLSRFIRHPPTGGGGQIQDIYDIFL